MTLELHPHVVAPELVLQTVIETIVSMPARKIRKVMIIPGYGHNSSTKKAGIQSCNVAILLAIANIPIKRLEGMRKHL